MIRDFNPRSRTGSDPNLLICPLRVTKISIHAPARGATRTGNVPGTDRGFQSTLPHGERPCAALFTPFSSDRISIHAPARGATLMQCTHCTGYMDFNPRSRTGSDALYLYAWGLIPGFQSTLPHGERLIFSILAPLYFSDFNPRSRTGSDPLLLVQFLIHSYFNPRSRTGSDQSRRELLACRSRFQSTLPHGERLAYSDLGEFPALFQSTLPHGERQQIWTNLICKICRNLI